MKAKRIYIKNNAKKLSPQRAHWGEEGLEKVTLPAGTTLFHASVMGKIKAFAPGVTCFSVERPALPGEIYIAITKGEIEAERHEKEYRIDLEEDTPIEIYHIGACVPSRFIKERWNMSLDTPRKLTWFRPRHYVLTEEYKDLEVKWNNEEETLTPEAIARGWRIVEA